ncbi:hypothetical protein OUZ56_032129 [Daphnia magna]|uniref:THAP-type domain-containing protein n=1 Tax=Daphnia magna TaxID=35525 RepID=A0ABQ9ZWB9_9CRUS|nr:hypothetical protein OUZ56_032129 [Daphnia magna]
MCEWLPAAEVNCKLNGGPDLHSAEVNTTYLRQNVPLSILDMPDRCFAPNCNAVFPGFKSDTNIAFFKPPKDCDLLTKWKQSIPREDTDIEMSSRNAQVSSCQHDGFCLKRKGQSIESKYVVREHADNLPDDWEAVPVQNLPIDISSWTNFEPKRSSIPPSWYWIESNNDEKTQLNLIDPKEMLENRFSRILRDFDNATICKGVLEEKFGGIKYCAGAAFEKEDW